MRSLTEIQEKIKEIIATELTLDITEINNTSSFHDMGLDSVNSIFLLAQMEEELNIHIDPMSVYDNPTVNTFSEYLHTQLNEGN